MRAEADALDAASRRAADGPGGLAECRAVARGGWHGDAAVAFDGLAGDVAVLLDGVVHVCGAAGAPLRIYADVLEQAQRVAAEAFERYQQGWKVAFGPGNTPESQAAGFEAARAAVAEMEAARETARAANERAAQAIQALAGMMMDGRAGALDALHALGIVSALAFGSAEALNKYASKHWMKTVWTKPLPGGTRLVTGPKLVPDEAARARTATNAKWFKAGGVAAGGVLGGVSQWQKDADNPTYSTGERVGRAAGATVSMGAAAAAGATIGSLVPGAGTAVGALAGLAVGFVAGYVASGWVDDHDAWIVDGVGDFGDWVGDNIDHITAW